MNAIVKAEQTALQLSEGELIDVLATSLYPGVSVNSIKMVLGYCKATGLDPLQKPVHPVPMWDAKSGMMRDVVMPGIGLYRIQASRSGQHIGTSEPEFGPDVTEKIGGFEITYPKWCKVVVSRRLHTGEVAEYTAMEFWKENYATRGGKEKSIAPNAMWSKRPYGQIAKCAESQALRRAFPECDKGPTAEEMEGKAFNDPLAGADVVLDTRPELDADALVKEGWAKAEKGMAEFGPWFNGLPKLSESKHRDVIRPHRDAMLAMAKQVDDARTVEQPAKQAGNPAAPVVTYEDLKAKIENAQTLDALMVSADWIGEIADPAQREELTQRYLELAKKFGG